MLRQLLRLTRRVPAAGPWACALAVYADETDRPLRARDRGDEGVACVDDAARALALACDLWVATGREWTRAWARSLLELVLFLQLPDGRFVNFLLDWQGAHNLDGETSAAGGGFWQARGMRGLARAAVVLGDPRAGEGFARALAAARRVDAAPDVRAIQASALLEALRAKGDPELRAVCERWCDEIAAHRLGDVMLDAPGTVHLWGHTQEAVLADASVAFARPDLLEIAIRSAEAVFVPAIESHFALDTVQPYGAACAVRAMDSLAVRTGDARYAALAADARAWFDGRNSAHAPVYDRERGRVADGIDRGVVNRRSGAEANIVGAQALFAEAVTLAAGPTPSARTRADRSRVPLTTTPLR